MEIKGTIVKRDDDKFLVYGWASVANDKDGNPVVDSQGDIISIQELEKAAHGFVRFSGKLAPMWAAAIAEASKKATRGMTVLSDSNDYVRGWINTHGGELITRLSDESRLAVMNVILRGQGLRMAPRDIAKEVRPLIGLTDRQAAANQKYKQEILQRYLERGMSESKAAERAEKAALKYAGKQHRYRAETIVLTENAFAYNRGAHMSVIQSIADGYMGRCAMIWTTAGTNRVCSRCLALKDTVVGYTDESGVLLPPLHPRCRCAIMYDEVGTRSGNLKPRGATKLTYPTENAIVYDNGNRNGYTINFELIRTKAYHDKFENLTKRKVVNESLYQQALKILSRRSGTEYEETVILNARTGELLVENADLVGIKPMRSGLRQEQKDYLEKLGMNFVALHNHPNSSFLSPEDIKTLFVRNLETASVIACHDGTVYF